MYILYKKGLLFFEGTDELRAATMTTFITVEFEGENGDPQAIIAITHPNSMSKVRMAKCGDIYRATGDDHLLDFRTEHGETFWPPGQKDLEDVWEIIRSFLRIAGDMEVAPLQIHHDPVEKENITLHD